MYQGSLLVCFKCGRKIAVLSLKLFEEGTKTLLCKMLRGQIDLNNMNIKGSVSRDLFIVQKMRDTGRNSLPCLYSIRHYDNQATMPVPKKSDISSSH